MNDLKENIMEGIHRAADMSTGHYFMDDTRSSGEIVKERGGEMLDTAKTGAAELYDRFNEDTREKIQDVRFAINDKVEDLKARSNEATNEMKENVAGTTESLKEYIGHKLEDLKETILHGDHEAHEIMTGHGLREAEPNSDTSFIERTKDKASEFKESARETMQDLTSQGAEKMDTLAEKTENVKESIKQNVDIAGEKIQELCEESEMKLNDAATSIMT